MAENPAAQTESQCPDCGQYIGPLSRCPNCGCRPGTHIRIKTLRTAALLLGIVGLFLLYTYSVKREIPLVKVAAVNPMMNFGSVRIQGVISGNVRTFKSGGFHFPLDDGSGVITVLMSQFGAKQLNALPQKGDRISVSGTLSMGAGKDTCLRVQTAGQLILNEDTVRSDNSSLCGITLERKGDRVRIRGRVTKIWNPGAESRAPHRMILSDGTGTLPCVYWGKVAAALSEQCPAVGDRVEVYGRIDAYRGEVQLKVFDAASVVILEKAL